MFLLLIETAFWLGDIVQSKCWYVVGAYNTINYLTAMQIKVVNNAINHEMKLNKSTMNITS